MSSQPDHDGVPSAAIAKQAQAWLVRLRSGRATADDAAAFRRWCAERPEHARAASLMLEAWDGLEAASAELDAEDSAADSTPHGQRGARPASWRAGRRAFMGAGVAAAASWLALRPPLQLWPALGDLAADYRTATGEQRRVVLSDRLVVEMNTQTRIDIVRTDGGTQGGAHGIDLLAGEAEVVAGAGAGSDSAAPQPVVVRAARGSLQAVSARFNLKRSGDEVCVTCVAGEVTLQHPQGRFTLTAAQQITYGNRVVQPPVNVDSSLVTAWRRGVLVFENAPLSDVVSEINRYRPGRIILRNAELADARVHAQVALAKIGGAVDLISKITGAHVTRLPGDIVLLS
ncbi:FecR family protein [Paraburkholderia sp. ZP32-5]|uniref:FecR family protein n=1 Tax=Paraburkholderia sp. ZP32-5 TaxID=2883245 RepID=UPI001F1F7C6F|nr:FecR domain-containing protein [Paraburkholderia sp. ZP32-5]